MYIYKLYLQNILTDFDILIISLLFAVKNISDNII